MQLIVCPTSMFNDYYCWTCPGAPHNQSIRVEELSMNAKYPFSGCSATASVSVTPPDYCPLTCKWSTPISTPFVSAWQKTFCKTELTERKVGGPEIEIYESKFGKRKYNREGRVFCRCWPLGDFAGLQESFYS